jgi:hypothetical protein
MEYKLVEILVVKDNWETRVTKIDGDRVMRQTEPSGMGWYYYPSDMSDREAFEKLKAHMLMEHNDRIGRLQMSADKLCTLYYGDNK